MRITAVRKAARGLALLVVFISPFGWLQLARPNPNEQILGEYSIASIADADRARAALSATADARRNYLEQWQAQNNDCRQRIAVTRCQSDLKAKRQAYESKIGAIEIHARQVIRNASLTERNAAEARNSFQSSTPGTAKSGSEKADMPVAANTDPQSQRALQQQARIGQHEATLAKQKLAGVAESKRRADRVAELERRRAEQLRKIEEGRKKAASRKNASKKDANKKDASKK